VALENQVTSILNNNEAAARRMIKTVGNQACFPDPEEQSDPKKTG
jgi:hypothetical protein